jgi:cell division protein FtsI/penicillin-binding protein 2
MARAYLTIARFGEQIEPMLISKVLTHDEILRPEVRRTRVIGHRAAGVIGRAMRSVVENPRGTGHRMRSERWYIAAKTGTGQDDRDLGNGVYNAWFCSFAPATDPEIVVVVHTQLKRHGSGPYTGGKVSGPPARKLIEKTLEHLRIPPDRPRDEGVPSSRER